MLIVIEPTLVHNNNVLLHTFCKNTLPYRKHECRSRLNTNGYIPQQTFLKIYLPWQISLFLCPVLETILIRNKLDIRQAINQLVSEFDIRVPNNWNARQLLCATVPVHSLPAEYVLLLASRVSRTVLAVLFVNTVARERRFIPPIGIIICIPSYNAF